MINSAQVRKAEKLLSLHHSGKLLVLPNIWNVIGARMLEHEGFQAVATASAAVAYSNGYADGEYIGFPKLLSILKEICDHTSLPVTADIERGYAGNIKELKENIRALIATGVVGINIEDSGENKDLTGTQRQCERIKSIRDEAASMGIPMVINARTDIFLQNDYAGNKVEEAVDRARNYREAGADCFYPILCSNEDLIAIRSRIDFPINVIATKDTLPMKKLEDLGIARLSLGPALLRAALSKMREVMQELLDYRDYASFTGSEILSSPDVRKILKL